MDSDKMCFNPRHGNDCKGENEDCTSFTIPTVDHAADLTAKYAALRTEAERYKRDLDIASAVICRQCAQEEIEMTRADWERAVYERDLAHEALRKELEDYKDIRPYLAKLERVAEAARNHQCTAARLPCELCDALADLDTKTKE